MSIPIYGEIHQIAGKIVQRGIESFVERRDIPVKIPQYEVDAEMGFSVEWAQHYFEKGLATLAQALKDGKVLGIVNLVGCSNPRVIYEKKIVETAEILLEKQRFDSYKRLCVICAAEAGILLRESFGVDRRIIAGGF